MGEGEHRGGRGEVDIRIVMRYLLKFNNDKFILENWISFAPGQIGK